MRIDVLVYYAIPVASSYSGRRCDPNVDGAASSAPSLDCAEYSIAFDGASNECPQVSPLCTSGGDPAQQMLVARLDPLRALAECGELAADRVGDVVLVGRS